MLPGSTVQPKNNQPARTGRIYVFPTITIRSVVFHWLRNKRSGKCFSHTWLGVCVWGFRSHGLCKSFSFCFAVHHCLCSFQFSVCAYRCLHVLNFFCFWWRRIITLRNLELLIKGLEPYNKNPTNCSSGQSGDDCASDCSSLGRSSRSRSSQACSLPLRDSSELTDWSKELLIWQQASQC